MVPSNCTEKNSSMTELDTESGIGSVSDASRELSVHQKINISLQILQNLYLHGLLNGF